MAVTSLTALFAIFVSRNNAISHKIQDVKTIVSTNHSSALSKLCFLLHLRIDTIIEPFPVLFISCQNTEK